MSQTAPNIRALPQANTTWPVAKPAFWHWRHIAIIASFTLIVVLPTLLAAAYLYLRAADQYVSRLAFSVRSEEAAAPIDLLGSLGAISGASSKDTDILNDFATSQEIVARIDDNVDLWALFSKPVSDPVFALNERGSIEDLVRYWRRQIRVSYDAGAGILDIEVRAFDPRDAQKIAREILAESTEAINSISAISRADATKYAEQELARAEQRLMAARHAMTEFRSRAQTIDPSADMGVQTEVLAALMQRHTDALIELDLLSEITSGSDTRVAQVRRKIGVIEGRIAEERAKFSSEGRPSGAGDYSSLVGEFENLTVDREFAEHDYLSALKTYEVARAEALRQTRYLATHVRPTLAETPEHPKRIRLTALCTLFSLLIWSMGVLVYYSVRDRR